MTTPSSVPLAAPDRDRAVHALERAVACAERGVSDRPVVLIEAADLSGLSPTDVRGWLDRVMMGEYADAGLDSLLATGVLDAVLPEIKALVGFGDGEWRHKDVWKHTKQVVAQSIPRIEVRYAALFHDIGKVKTRSISPDGPNTTRVRGSPAANGFLPPQNSTELPKMASISIPPPYTGSTARHRKISQRTYLSELTSRLNW